MSLTATRPSLARRNPLPALASSIAALRGWRRAGFCATLGAVSVLGFAPFDLWPLLVLTLPCFVWLLDGIAASAGPAKPRWRQAAFAGWCFGFGFFVAGLYWMGHAFFVEADKFAWLVPLAVAALPAALSLFYALACAAAIRLWRPGAARVFILAATLFAAEWLRGTILTGLPWNLWGYALAANDALAQSASIFGIYGLTLIALVIFASPATLAGPTAHADARRWPLSVFCLALLALGWGFGTLRLAGAGGETQPGVTLRIVQANIPQAEKWKPENRQWIFERLLSLSAKPPEAAGITHLIWPETSVPFLFMLNGAIASPEARDAFARLIPDGTSLILGAERVEGTPRADGRYDVTKVFNSLFVLDSDARVLASYDKLHLVPFGEYVPFEAALTALGIKQLTHMNTGFDAGTARRLLTAPGAPPFAPLICYEAIFPSQINAEDGRPHWLLNLTNDAWFGISTGPHQHLQQVRMRAVEQGLPLVRAANTGISAVIDAHGRVRASLPLGEIGTIDHALPASLAPTPYSRGGDAWLILVAFLIFILYRIVTIVE